ncbi:hypothetical protein KFE98_00490 [bacterium SCSIO 12741]|nr:hypothetical protein KFE98_00490 [bacterium SCSIO 12741]
MKYIALVLILSLNCFTAFSQDPDFGGKKHSINSKYLNESREIWVGLPAGYDSTISYPTIYVMDAEYQFDITYAIMKELAVNDKIPNHIVVGIPYQDPQKRVYDLTFTTNSYNSDGTPDSLIATYFSDSLTGGGVNFLKYLVDEVVPWVNSEYNTNGFDVYIGHSLSGYFGAYMLVQENPFEALQLYDPSIWYEHGDVIRYVEKNGNSKIQSNVFISTANGGKERQQYNVDTHQEFYDLLQGKKVNSELKIYEEGHSSVRLPSLIDGLTNLYEGYAIGTIMPTDTITAQDVKDHYAAFSNKVNFEFTPTVEAFRWTGYVNHYQGKWPEAIDAYKECTSLYKSDLMMLLEFADCYFQLEEYGKSMEVYEMVLEIDPTNEGAQLRKEEIKKLLDKG